jgi:ribosomal protein S18 acetylase RimI-like enzyme
LSRYANKVMSTCSVRKLNFEDAATWASLRQEALETHPLVFGASVPDDPKNLIDFVRTRLGTDEDSVVFGAFVGASMVGMVGIVRNSRPKERHKSALWGMYVTSGSRRDGAGERLLRAAIQQAQSWTGVEQVQLSVTNIAKDARRMYERNGFREWGREPRALCWEGSYVDESYMVLDIAKRTA